MGYYTDFSLETVEENGMTRCSECDTLYEVDHKKNIAKHIGGYNPFEDVCKWYSYEKDMTAYSKNYPNTMFILSGEGEESGDIWKAWYENGASYRETARVQIADFDASKMVND